MEIPDLTIGLCTYNLDFSPWIERIDLLGNDRVKLFDRASLRDLQKHFELRAPYRRPGKRVTDNHPMFAFGLWEAKKASAAHNNQTALVQSARKLKTLLRWQNELNEKSTVRGCPLVWYFNNVGSSWKVYGCHVQRSSRAAEGLVYVSFPCAHTLSMVTLFQILRELWSGDSKKEDHALQLLYIVDIIAIWAEHNYKPFVGSCISHLQAIKNDERLPSVDSTLRTAQIEINRTNFPWLFDPDRKIPTSPKSAGDNLRVPYDQNLQDDGLSGQSHSRSPSRGLFGQAPSQKPNVVLSRQSRPQSPSGGRFGQSPSPSRTPNSDLFGRSLSRSPNRPNRPLSEQFLSGRQRQSITSSHGDYIIPELHNYIWLLDRDPGAIDLLVIRVDEKGDVLPPVVIFDSDGWEHPHFRYILRHERPRWHPDIITKFNFNKADHHYMWQCIFKDPEYFCKPRVQFCAILPLDRDSYKRQRAATNKQDELFDSLVTLLALPDLLADADHAYDKWCLCDAPWNEYSPPMILCDNSKCRVGWYHMKCVGLDDWFETDNLWICPECLRTPFHTHVYSEDEGVEYDEALYEASTARIQRTKTVARVWADHEWPYRDDVLGLFDKISCSIDIDTTVQYSIPQDGNGVQRAPQGCWALSKSRPENMITVRTSGLNHVPETQYAVEDVNNIFSGMNLGRNVKH